MKQEKVYLTAISVTAGIITLLAQDGVIKKYRQTGISSMTDEQRLELIRLGLLERNWHCFEEIPKQTEIFYEDEEILGKASKRYPTGKEIVKVFDRKE